MTEEENKNAEGGYSVESESGYIERTRMLHDYINAWTPHGLKIQMSQLTEVELPPIETYEEYMRRQQLEHAQAIIDAADPAALRKVNEVVSAFNALPREERVRQSTYQGYLNNVRAALEGR